MTYRRLALLIRHLPADSWTQTRLRDDSTELVDTTTERKFGQWALTNYQLADLRDEIAALRFVTARAAGNERYPEPKPTPRPGLNRPVRRQTAAAVAYLKKLRGRS